MFVNLFLFPIFLENLLFTAQLKKQFSQFQNAETALNEIN